MSKLMSLLCCSADSSDDAGDRYAKNRTADRSPSKRASLRSANGDVKLLLNIQPIKSSDKSKDKSEILDEDNSVNETDTITNNDELNKTQGVNGSAPVAAQESTTANGKSNDSSHKQPTNEKAKHGNNTTKDTAAVATSASSSNGATTAPVASDIITSVDQNLPTTHNIVHDDDADLLDLTKIQEGQSFDPETGCLLGKKDKKFGNKKCLILDLDETLVHSSFKYLRIADFVIPVQIDNQVHHVYVIKRPGVDEFLKKVGQWFEVVVFTASVLKYGDPLLDKLDIHNSVHHRLFRDSCYNYQGNFIKNLSQIGRPLSDSIIIDNSPASYFFHPQHSIPISSWFSDTHDNELLDLLPFLEDISKPNVDDVGLVLDISL